jgi:hypothetical protein
MKKVNYAAIDIGSNAVRLLIKCVNEENAPELMSKVQLGRRRLYCGGYLYRKREETDSADESLQTINEDI